jgi:hypothetical protein
MDFYSWRWELWRVRKEHDLTLVLTDSFLLHGEQTEETEEEVGRLKPHHSDIKFNAKFS